jgi:hypothetical protein
MSVVSAGITHAPPCSASLQPFLCHSFQFLYWPDDCSLGFQFTPARLQMVFCALSTALLCKTVCHLHSCSLTQMSFRVSLAFLTTSPYFPISLVLGYVICHSLLMHWHSPMKLRFAYFCFKKNSLCWIHRIEFYANRGLCSWALNKYFRNVTE